MDRNNTPKVKIIMNPDPHPWTKEEDYYVTSYEEFTAFQPYEDRPEFFSWDFEEVTESDIVYLKSLELKIDEKFGKYKCVNERLHFTAFVLSYAVENDIAKLKIFVKEGKQIIHFYHSPVENPYFPRLFIGDRIRVTFIPDNLSGQTCEYNFCAEEEGLGSRKKYYSEIRSTIMCVAICISQLSWGNKPDKLNNLVHMRYGYKF